MASALAMAALLCGVFLILKDVMWLIDAKKTKALYSNFSKKKQGFFNSLGILMFIAGLVLTYLMLLSASLLEYIVAFFAAAFIIGSMTVTIPGLPAAAWAAVGKHKDSWFKVKGFVAVAIGILIVIFVYARAF